jgi:conjugative relaxase-like TrwC/TraI family protein
VVLTIHVVRQGGHHYYVHDLVPGRAEGGLVAGEEPGVWTGAGTGSLGLAGPVGSSDFAEVLEGRDPCTGLSLRRPRGDRSSAGFDLTFSAPKSVSLLHLLAPGEMSAAAGAGHQAAVADAIGYLGREGVGVRRTRRGQVAFLPTTGPVAGAFLHRTSRALDPHLHTHVVVANVAQGVDGAWSSLDSRRLHAHLTAAQSVYHARLRFELGDRMGAAWELRPSGMGDVVGVEGSLRRLFSQRTASMDEHHHRRGGREPPVGAPEAGGLAHRPPAGCRPGRTLADFYADRPEKDTTVTVDQLRDEWRQRAAEFGFDLGDLTRAVGVHRRDPEPVIDPERLCDQLAGLTRDHRSIGREAVVAAVAASTPGGAVGLAVETAAARLIEACAAQDGPCRRPGASPPTGVAAGRWSPADLLRTVEGGRLAPWLAEGAGRDPVALTWSRGGDRALEGSVGRNRRIDGPGPPTHSLGLER